MKTIFKLGDHTFGGASLYYIEALKTYSFMITLFMLHFMIDHGDGSLRVGLGFGNDQIHIKLHIGFN